MAGKRLDDLHLSDEPIERAAPLDERATEWYQFVGTIGDLLAGGDYEWAADTLTGISETVERTRKVTLGQRQAVENIVASKENRRDKWRFRRYEGFNRGGRR
jgi:hypothetical protein